MCPAFSRSSVTFAIWAFLPLTVVAEEIATVADDAASTRPLRVGDSIPEISLTDAKGRVVSLESLHRDRPAVLTTVCQRWINGPPLDSNGTPARPVTRTDGIS